MIRSKYEEDIYPNNHSSVWGSYWHAGQWGFRCCHSFIKNSYCTGEAGKRALETTQTSSDLAAASGQTTSGASQDSSNETTRDSRLDSSNQRQGAAASSSTESSSDSSSEEERTYSKTERKSSSKRRKRRKQKEKRRNRKRKDKKPDDDDDNLQKALAKEAENQREAERILKMDERKRPYNSMYQAKEPTADEIEAYQMKRQREEDPMA